ncbi:MAG: hypothetical protein LBC97_05135 [Bifidobacteriaceae bacterium]|nr:hypothetical protein [Bifidobacteriaceae bacterium]
MGLVPGGRAPHYDVGVGSAYGRTFGSVQVTASNAADLADRLMSAASTVVENRHRTDGLA